MPLLSQNMLDQDQRKLTNNPADMELVASFSDKTLHIRKLNNSLGINGFHSNYFGYWKQKRKWIHDIFNDRITNI